MKGKNNKTNQDVAIKIEPADGHSQLLYESKVYRYLQGGSKHNKSFFFLIFPNSNKKKKQNEYEG
jgi:hypothetical protein